MSEVSSNLIGFPGIGLTVKANQIAFQLGDLKVYTYAVCVIFAIIFSLFLCHNAEEKFGLRFGYVLEVMIPAIFWGIIGARLYYVIFNLDYYMQKPISILNIRDGGLAIYGGFLTALLVIVKKCIKDDIDYYNFLDHIVPFVAIGQSIGRWGNFFNQEAYGVETTSLLRMRILTKTGYINVHPTFLYESVATLIIFFILRLTQLDRKFKGEVFYLYLFLYSGVRFLIEEIRADSLMLGDYKISQIVSLLIFVTSGVILLKNFIKYTFNRRK